VLFWARQLDRELRQRESGPKALLRKRRLQLLKKHDRQTFDERNHQRMPSRRCKGQEEENGSGSESEAVRQVEGLLGGEKNRQEVNLSNLMS